MIFYIGEFNLARPVIENYALNESPYSINSHDESRDNKLRSTATAAIDPSSPSALERQTQLVAATLRNSVKQEFQLTRGSRER
uniref:Uncharacterized protein n=1 Tax=Trichogramma kaykai TaxID=54128 RepID=A0ABD2WL63_9HYME